MTWDEDDGEEYVRARHWREDTYSLRPSRIIRGTITDKPTDAFQEAFAAAYPVQPEPEKKEEPDMEDWYNPTFDEARLQLDTANGKVKQVERMHRSAVVLAAAGVPTFAILTGGVRLMPVINELWYVPMILALLAAVGAAVLFSFTAVQVDSKKDGTMTRSLAYKADQRRAQNEYNRQATLNSVLELQHTNKQLAKQLEEGQTKKLA